MLNSILDHKYIRLIAAIARGIRNRETLNVVEPLQLSELLHAQTVCLPPKP